MARRARIRKEKEPSRLYLPPITLPAQPDAEADKARQAECLRAWRDKERDRVERFRNAGADVLPSGVSDDYAQYADGELRFSARTGADVVKAAGADKVYPINRKQAKAAAVRVAADVGILQAEFTADPPPDWVQEKALRTLCRYHNTDYPESRYGRAPVVARLSSPDWWGRKLRLADWREYEMRKIRTGEVRRYCSDEIARATRWHREAVRQLLDNLFAVRDDAGAVFTLLELAERSTSNPMNRRAEMVVRTKGVAQLAKDKGWTWAFWTLTCPSKYHSMTTANDGQRLRNPKWNGSSPREGQKYLRTVFARIRSKLARLKIDYMLVRVAEPHLDGCPHWHGIVWTHPENLKAVRDVMREHGLAEDGDEPGAKRRRVQWRKYRASAYDGSEVDAAVAYLIAYIGKNIDGLRSDGEGIDGTKDRDGNRLDGDAADNAVRAVAWASLWGIKQFDFSGVPAKGPYVELRRIRKTLGNHLEGARAAADRADFAAYAKEAQQLGLDLMVETSRDRILALAEEEGLLIERETEEGELQPVATPALAEAVVRHGGLLNRWGEPVRRWVLGVTDGLAEVRTRLHAWRVTSAEELDRVPATRVLMDALRKRRAEQKESQASAGAGVSGALALAVEGRRSRPPSDSCQQLYAHNEGEKRC